MKKFLGVFGLMAILVSFMPGTVNAQKLTVTNQIKITATILPARHVLVDSNGKILQIVSNTSESQVEPTVYVGFIKSENIIPLTSDVSTKVDSLLAGKELKPGILFDYRNAEVLPNKTASSKINSNIWLSGIFNLKNVNPTVNLTRL